MTGAFCCCHRPSPRHVLTSLAEKRTKYSKYSCHEVNLFIYFKDRPFFDKVVAPYLRCKRTHTFMDHYLLGHNLEWYLSFNAFAELNAAEKALLCGRIAASAGGVSRGMSDRVEVAPTPPERFDGLFKVAIAGNALSDSSARDKMEAGIQSSLRARSMGGPAREMAFARSVMAAPSAPSMAMAACAPMPRMAMAKSMAAPSMMMDEGCNDDEEEAEMECKAEEADMMADFDMDMLRRQEIGSRQLYQAMDKTQEFAETHYYRRRLHECNGDSVISNSEFWADFAQHMTNPGGRPFVSKNILLATRNLNEMLLALAVTDLAVAPAAPANISVQDGRLVFGATEPMLVFYKVWQDLRVLRWEWS